MKKSLYKQDPIGFLLSFWRIHAVKKEVMGKLLDIACGDNKLVRSYRGKGLGIDLNDFKNVDLVVKNLSQIPLPSQSFDTATIVASLNYFPNAKEVLEEIKRILTDKCRLIITMPDTILLKFWLKLRDPFGRNSMIFRPHNLFISRSEMIKIIQSSGFKVVKERQFMLNLNRIYICNKS